MQQYNCQNGQSWYDVCLNTYGSLDYLGKLVSDNGGELNVQPTTNTVIYWDQSLVKDSSLLSLIKNNGYVYNTGVQMPLPYIQSYSFSAKFSAVSSLDLTGCFLDLIGNDCATLINWGDGTIDSNLTHTYSISGDYVVSVACSDAFEIKLKSRNITEFYYALPIGLQNLELGDNQIVDFNPSIALPIGLQSLELGGNQIVDFNPSIALPSGLQSLDLSGNQMTIAGYTASETWANAQPSFTSSCNVYFTSNIDSVSGTDLETILISKNCTISA